jgi:hypothetical protein
MSSITINKDSLSINKLKEALKEISIAVYEDGEGGLVFKRQKLKPKVCVSYEQMQNLFKPFFDKIKYMSEELRLTDPDPVVRTFEGEFPYDSVLIDVVDFVHPDHRGVGIDFIFSKNGVKLNEDSYKQEWKYELQDTLRSKIKNGRLCYSDFLKCIDPKLVQAWKDNKVKVLTSSFETNQFTSLLDTNPSTIFAIEISYDR